MILDLFKNRKDVHSKQRSIFVSVSTNPGSIRDVNEDSFFVTDIGCKKCNSFSSNISVKTDSISFYSVFDGMGGESYGEEASRIAAVTLKEFADRISSKCYNAISIKDFIEEYISVANNRICDMIARYKCRRSGCTMALAVIINGTVYPFSIGDSRIYLISHDSIKQISEDQTLAVKKLKANIYTEDEALTSPDSHKLTSFIGSDDRGVGISYHSYDPFPLSDSILLLCSDGLTDMCNDDEIASLVLKDSESTANALVETAIKHGGEDNITCIIIRKK